MDTITLTIDGKPVTAARGATVLEAARAAGIHIPTLCAHEDLPNFGACRLCIVEIDGVRGFPTSCTTPAVEGMVVRTHSDELAELRDNTLELMLSGHPNACLVCDHREDCERYRPVATKAGRSTRCGFCSNRPECGIRRMAIAQHSRRLDLPTIYSMHKVERDDPFIERDHNLCVLCGRCWRICEQIHGTPAISIIHRGRHARIGTAFGRSWVESGCTFCGACVDICPTATITDRYARWYADRQEAAVSPCTICPEGCSMRQIVSQGRIVATAMTSFKPESRLCAVGRFAFPQLINARHRLTRPLLREGGELVPVTWDEALAAVGKMLLAKRYEGFVAIVAESHTREAKFMYEKITREIMNGRVAYVPPGGGFDQIHPAEVRQDILAGRVKAAIVTGDYLSQEALGAIEYLVVIDFLPSAASERADAVLPAAVLAEAEGTFRNAAGEVKRLARAINAPGEARPEWTIVRDLGKAMGARAVVYTSVSQLTAAIEGDRPPPHLPGRPRDTLKDLPTRFRGHLIADHVPALAALGLPTSRQAQRLRPTDGFAIVEKSEIVPNFHRLVIKAPAVARHAKAGQFVILMVDEQSERAPFTLVDWDRQAGTITLIVEDVGRASHELALLQQGDRIAHVSGPLGLPLAVKKVGTVLVGGGCYGLGAIYPIARAMKEAGNRVICAAEACSEFGLYMEAELRQVCDELLIATKDGSRGIKGGVQEVILNLCQAGIRIDQIVAIGCAFMMRMVAEKTAHLGVSLQVALNPIMVDGTGMCGACRVAVDGQTKFACVDGPFFDGHKVDWEGLFARRGAFLRAEVEALTQVNGPGGRKTCPSNPTVALDVLSAEC
jgi:NAD(P)H-flavin reductase/ferredoxin